MTAGETRSKNETIAFQLFVADDEPHSRAATDNLRAICEKHFPGRHEIEVVDVFKHADAALKRNIFVTPALLKVRPPPQTTIYGNLSEKEKVLAALGLSGED